MTSTAKRLSACADDPMWANHAEVSKGLLRRAAADLEAATAALHECCARLDACRLVIADAECRHMVAETVAKARTAIAWAEGRSWPAPSA